MRVNIYAEETTDRFEVVERTVGRNTFSGVRLYLAFKDHYGKPQFPVHGPDDDDFSSSVTFWGSYADLRRMLLGAVASLDEFQKHAAEDHTSP